MSINNSDDKSAQEQYLKLYDRCTDMEMKLLEQDNLIETLDNVMTKQYFQITRLDETVKRLEKQLKIIQASNADGEAVPIDTPPHY